MKKNKIYLRTQLVCLAFVFLVVTCSCTKEIKYKGDQGESKLVVLGLQEADSVIRLSLERSRFFLESKLVKTRIENAQVTLKNVTDNTVENRLTASVNGEYIFMSRALEGNQYELSVKHPKYGEVKGYMKVPSHVPIVSVDTLSFGNSSFSDGVRLECKIKWKDRVGLDQYFLVVKGKEINSIESYHLPLRSKDPSINKSSDDIENEVYGEYFAISDENFQGLEKTLTLTIPFQDKGIIDELHFELYHCSEDAYKYLLSVDRAYKPFEDALSGIFEEPSKVFSNIEGGYGVFEGINKSTFKLKL